MSAILPLTELWICCTVICLTISAYSRPFSPFFFFNAPAPPEFSPFPLRAPLPSPWGPLGFGDFTLPFWIKPASSVVVQVIGDPLYPTVPSTCPGPAENTITAFGANGILGVGPFAQDCGSACVATAQPSTYYSCPSTSTCVASTATLHQQLAKRAT